MLVVFERLVSYFLSKNKPLRIDLINATLTRNQFFGLEAGSCRELSRARGITGDTSLETVGDLRREPRNTRRGERERRMEDEREERECKEDESGEQER